MTFTGTEDARVVPKKRRRHDLAAPGTRVAFKYRTDSNWNFDGPCGGEPIRIDEVLQRIQGEFVEMPGLRLTPAQAQRLWGLEREVCDALLGALVDAKFLAQTRDGAFVRMEGARPTTVMNAAHGQRLAVA
jgi:hypothetical protein